MNAALRVMGVALLIASAPLQAQDSAVVALRSHPLTVELWGGLASNSPRWGLLGAAPQMNLALTSVRFAQVVGEPSFLGNGTRLEYTFDLIPVAKLSTPFRSARGTGAPCPRSDLCVFPQADQSGRLFPRRLSARVRLQSGGTDRAIPS